MSYYKHPLDDIHVGDYVSMEVTTNYVGEEPYTYTISGIVRIHDRVKCVGREGLGAGRIVEHRPRPLPTEFGSHIKYPNGSEWVKIDGENWRSETGKSRLNREMNPGWVMIRDAGRKS